LASYSVVFTFLKKLVRRRSASSAGGKLDSTEAYFNTDFGLLKLDVRAENDISGTAFRASCIFSEKKSRTF
jgi:hypothetical protein